MNPSNFTFLTCNFVYVVSRASVTWQECNTLQTDMAAGEKIATLKIKALTVSQAGAKMQQKYVFAVSRVKGMVEAHAAERPFRLLKDCFSFSLREMDRAKTFVALSFYTENAEDVNRLITSRGTFRYGQLLQQKIGRTEIEIQFYR